ncbi:LOW QUALITY PROTEIN: embryonic polarity protein dorsal [Manduca sexta]|uniref:LOW QUALITY PROTEIN: embryonic polarity protein dorsal n=1 Tax=Manduca sexta TaxID=7130 RepID=UPI00188DD368|nr:LOW QUALITY PROTEIN: embryonic polarity protein dorsal [Manduca sexta]
MDVGGDAAVILGTTEQNDSEPSNLNISDVFEAITLADPSFGAGVPSVEETMAHTQPQPLQMPYVVVVQQPASKALRFRYECEGRSAGSIPGASSTPENRTFPAIKIIGYTGTVSIVVSCVTKDEPYRPHPHNLVGRDHCDRGVFSVRTEITDENNEYQFRNLGIQCVKRRDIGEALRIREDLRVDPFKTGFTHRNHPQGIDLNAVRLAFQVFLPHSSGKMRRTLAPVVSDVIYDKKAMSDLLIMRASHCAGPARGGTQVILLCEKVTREDTVVVFYQEDNNRVLWEEMAIIIVVHKQYAIAFETPPYKNPNITDNVNVRFQLRRLSDKMTSNSLPFEYIPEYQGTIRKPLPDLSFLSLLLNEKRTDTNNNKPDKQEAVSSTTDSVAVSESGADVTDVNGNLEPDADVDVAVDTNEKSLNELLEQVAELDEIYSENRTRLETMAGAEPEPDGDADDFNDAGTYTSLQLAFKNPVTITEPEPTSYEDVPVHTFRGPIIEFTPLKRDSDDDRAPPLPPKRVRKSTSTEPFKTSQTSVDSILKPGRQLPVTRDRDVLKHENHLTVAKSEPALPPVKKRSFFSRLFRRKEKSPAPSVKSRRQGAARCKPVGRSVSSVSGQRPSRFKSSVSHTSLKDNASGAGLSYADSVTHISLHGDDERSASASSLRRSVGPAPPTDGSILVAESVLALDASSFRRLQDELELTDAEHYALYMAVAPHATASEFDETSCYYSPVDGSKFHAQ